MELTAFGRGWCSETKTLTSCGEKGWSEEGESGTQQQKLHQGTNTIQGLFANLCKIY